MTVFTSADRRRVRVCVRIHSDEACVLTGAALAEALGNINRERRARGEEPLSYEIQCPDETDAAVSYKPSAE